MGSSSLPKAAVVVDHGDLLALELVPAALLLGDVLQHGVASDPVVAHQREVPLEHVAVGRVAAAVAGSDQRDLVGRHLLGEGEGDAGGQRLEYGGTTVLALQALVALHAAVGGVGGFALLDQGHHAVDAAAGIDQLHVVVVAVGPGRGVGRHRAGAAGQHREELHLGLREGAGALSRAPAPAATTASRAMGLQLHVCLQGERCTGVRGENSGNGRLRSSGHRVNPRPLRVRVNAGRATGAAFPCRWTTAGPGRAARRSGRRRSGRRRSSARCGRWPPC
jgi:hypothetical protein